jgi:hypothetical protein
MVCVVVLVAQLSTAQIASVTTATAQRKKAQSKAINIGRAVSGAPRSIATAAKVVERDEKGNETVLRAFYKDSRAVEVTQRYMH